MTEENKSEQPAPQKPTDDELRARLKTTRQMAFDHMTPELERRLLEEQRKKDGKNDPK